MDLKQIEYFVRVAEHGSFSRAAVALQVAQPALSRQVGALETELRQRLLDRNGRGVTLTAAGRRLLAHGIGILQQVERARLDLEDHRGAPVGRLALGLPPSVSRNFTAPLVQAFRERFPKATLSVVESLSAYMVEWLAQGRIDAAVVYPVPLSASVDLEPLLEEPLVLVRSAELLKDHKKGQKKGHQPMPGFSGLHMGPAVGLDELANQSLVIPSRPHSIRMLVDATLAAASLKPRIGLEIESVPAMLSLVAQGSMAAVLTLNALRDWPGAAWLAAQPIEAGPGSLPLSIRLWLATSSQRPKGPLIQESLGLLRQQLQPLAVIGGR